MNEILCAVELVEFEQVVAPLVVSVVLILIAIIGLIVCVLYDTRD